MWMSSSELYRLLAELYPNKERAERVVDDLGMERGRIDFTGESWAIWRSIINEAERQGPAVLRALVDYARREYPGNPELSAWRDASSRLVYPKLTIYGMADELRDLRDKQSEHDREHIHIEYRIKALEQWREALERRASTISMRALIISGFLLLLSLLFLQNCYSSNPGLIL